MTLPSAEAKDNIHEIMHVCKTMPKVCIKHNRMADYWGWEEEWEKDMGIKGSKLTRNTCVGVFLASSYYCKITTLLQLT